MNRHILGQTLQGVILVCVAILAVAAVVAVVGPHVNEQRVFAWLSVTGVIAMTTMGWYTTWREKAREQLVKDREVTRQQEIKDHEALRGDTARELATANGEVKRLAAMLDAEYANRINVEGRERKIHERYVEILNCPLYKDAAGVGDGRHAELCPIANPDVITITEAPRHKDH